MNAAREPWHDVYDALRDVGPAKSEAIADASGWDIGLTRRCLRALLEAGAATYNERDGYTVSGPQPDSLSVRRAPHRDRTPPNTALDFAILDTLSRGPRPMVEIAELTRADFPAVRGRMSWLSSAGVVAKDGEVWRLACERPRVRAAVLANLTDPAGMRALDLAALLRLGVDDVRSVLRELEHEGRAMRSGSPARWRRT